MNKKKISERQEKKIAKQTNGRVVPLSGGLKTSAQWKGDVNTDYEKIECKVTTLSSYKLMFNDLNKIRSQALKYGREPVFLFEFINGAKGKYVCLFEPNDEEVNENKSITFKAEELFKNREKEPIYQCKYRDGEKERSVSIYSYETFLRRREQ